jgi:hypothetical protein
LRPGRATTGRLGRQSHLGASFPRVRACAPSSFGPQSPGRAGPWWAKLKANQAASQGPYGHSIFSDSFFPSLEIVKLDKKYRKLQKYIFLSCRKLQRILDYFIPLRTLVLLFIFYAIFPVNYETNVD